MGHGCCLRTDDEPFGSYPTSPLLRHRVVCQLCAEFSGHSGYSSARTLADGSQPFPVLLRCGVGTVLWLQPAGCEIIRGSDLELVAAGHDGWRQGAL